MKNVRRPPRAKEAYVVRATLRADHPMNLDDQRLDDLYRSILDKRSELMKLSRSKNDPTIYMRWMDKWLESMGYDSIYNGGRGEFVVYDADKVRIDSVEPFDPDHSRKKKRGSGGLAAIVLDC